MDKTKFSATISKYCETSIENASIVRSRAIEITAEDMRKTKPQGGNVPFQDGELSRSLIADKTGLPKTSDGPFPDYQDVGVITATLKANEPVWLAYTVNYARRQNYGFVGADTLGRVYNQQGNHFVEKAIANWQKNVEQAAKEVTGAG